MKHLTLVVDGNNLAHRARHTFSLSNKGVDVSVTYGVLKILNSYLDKYKPDSVIFAWDGGVPEFRRVAVPEYKANRHKDDDPLAYEDFIRQMSELADYALPMMGILSITLRGAEADDLLYHASRILSGDIIIVTSDKDLLQACNQHVRVLNPSKDRLFTVSDVEKEFDIEFSNYIDWRALQGDGSDNIPGVPGIGEKTASKLFREYKTLTGIYNAAAGKNPNGKLSGKVADNILAFGLERIARNVYITALYNDRLGSRAAIVAAMRDYQPANTKRITKYLASNMFVSLMSGEFTGKLTHLSNPELAKGVRIPHLCPAKRVPVL